MVSKLTCLEICASSRLHLVWEIRLFNGELGRCTAAIRVICTPESGTVARLLLSGCLSDFSVLGKTDCIVLPGCVLGHF